MPPHLTWNFSSEWKEGCKTHIQPGGKICAKRLFAWLRLSFCPHDRTLLPVDRGLCGFRLGTFHYYVHSWCQIHVSLTLQHNGHLQWRHRYDNDNTLLLAVGLYVCNIQLTFATYSWYKYCLPIWNHMDAIFMNGNWDKIETLLRYLLFIVFCLIISM